MRRNFKKIVTQAQRFERDPSKAMGYREMLRHKETIRQLVIKHRGLCALCGEPVSLRHNSPNLATIDHIIPLSRGGLDTPTNQQLACLTCNNKKGNRLSEEM